MSETTKDIKRQLKNKLNKDDYLSALEVIVDFLKDKSKTTDAEIRKVVAINKKDTDKAKQRGKQKEKKVDDDSEEVSGLFHSGPTSDPKAIPFAKDSDVTDIEKTRHGKNDDSEIPQLSKQAKQEPPLLKKKTSGKDDLRLHRMSKTGVKKVGKFGEPKDMSLSALAGAEKERKSKPYVPGKPDLPDFEKKESKLSMKSIGESALGAKNASVKLIAALEKDDVNLARTSLVELQREAPRTEDLQDVLGKESWTDKEFDEFFENIMNGELESAREMMGVNQ